MAVDRCSKCNVSLGTQTQGVLAGTGKALLCPVCQRNETAAHYLKMLPTEEDEWDRLSEWEQEFIVSVRDQFGRRGTVSEKQFAILERLYGEKVG